ncbi:hypothetical protein BUE64_14260, partial [Corynebacterium diphtheriae subsp. lausannense]
MEAVHAGDFDLIMKLRFDYSVMSANASVFLPGATSKSQAGRMTFPSRNTPGCPHVGHSLMDSTGSASITVTITVFYGAADGIDD